MHIEMGYDLSIISPTLNKSLIKYPMSPKPTLQHLYFTWTDSIQKFRLPGLRLLETCNRISKHMQV